MRGDEPEVSLVRWLRFQCNCHGCKAGSVSWHAHLDVCVRKWALRTRATPSKSPSFIAIFLIILILPAPSLCPGKVPLITLVKTTSVVGNYHNIRYRDLCNAWNVTTIIWLVQKGPQTRWAILILKWEDQLGGAVCGG